MVESYGVVLYLGKLFIVYPHLVFSSMCILFVVHKGNIYLFLVVRKKILRIFLGDRFLESI